MTKNNALPPASQPWVRGLEARIKNLENKNYRTDIKVNSMSNRVMSPEIDLDSLNVTELHVGGTEPEVFEHVIEEWTIDGNTITAQTPPVPAQRGFIMEWEVDVVANVDHVQAHSSLDDEPYEAPADPVGAFADEENTFFADASYLMGDDLEEGEEVDDLLEPVPAFVSFTLHSPDDVSFVYTVQAMRMRFIIPGTGGLRVTEDGMIYLEDGTGNDRALQEISEEQAQAIYDTAVRLEQAQADLEDAKTEAEQNFTILDDKLAGAFPENIFNVDLAIEQAKQLAEQQYHASITGTVIEYARNTSEVTAPTSGWSTTPPVRTAGSFIWTRTTVTYGSGSTTTTTPVLLTGNAGAPGTPGQPGDKGETGVSVTSIAPYYRRLPEASVKPAKPTGMSPAGWTPEEPEYARDTTMWRSDRIVYSNGTVAWTDVSKLSSYEAAKAAESAALSYAESMRDVAIQAGAVDAQTKMEQALTQAKQDATDKANAAKTAAETAAKAHADLVAQGASADAIATAAADAKAKADAARDAAVAQADANLSNLQIGGRNLIRNSDFRSRHGGVFRYDHVNKAGEGGLNIVSVLGLSETIKQGQEYTLSFSIRGDNPTSTIVVYQIIPGGPNTSGVAVTVGGLSEDYRKVSYSFSPKTDLSNLFIFTGHKATAYDAWFEIEGKSLKLERGAKATDWTPAPEDVDAGIADAKTQADSAKADATTAVQRANAAVKDTKIEYAVNTSQTNPPTTGWGTSTPTRTPGSYVWMRTTITYGDNRTSVLAPVLVTGNDGAKGQAGADGSVITGSIVEYAQSASGTTRPSSWSATVPTPVPGQYIWTRTTFTYSVGPNQYSYSVGKIGEAGAPGAPGQPGAPGAPGSVITGSTVEYAQSASGTVRPSSWSTTVPAPVPGQYIWTRTTFTYSVGPAQYSYSVGKIGETGAPGQPGADGTTLTGTTLHYTQTTSGTTIPASGWQSTIPTPVQGQYMWTRTTWSFNNKPDQYGYSVALNGATGSKGDTGSPGTPGVSVSAITPFFMRRGKALAKPPKPTTKEPAGWSSTEPEYLTATKLWRTERVDFSNGTFQYTDVTEVGTYTGIDEAMTTANGKNSSTYTTVYITTEPPGPVPTQAMGSDRPQFDIHRNRRSNGEIIGEWIWTGTAWTQLTLTDAMLTSLDVGKLTTGTANIETAVVNKLWGQLGVFDRLDVRTDAYVSGVNLKDGAVTARTLNVVPEEGTGGMELKPPGLRIIPDDAEGGTAVSLRVDEENMLSFAKGGDTTFSVNGDGKMVVQELDVNSSFRYNDVELQDILDSMPKGIVSISRANAIANAGTNQARIVATTFRTPASHRMYRISFTARVTSVPPKRGIFYLRQSTGNSVNALNSSKQTWYSATQNNEHITFTGVYGTGSDLGWPLDETITIGVFAASTVTGESIQFHSAGPPELVVEDLGPEMTVESHTPYVPSTGGGSGGGGTEEQPAPREYVQTFTPTWHQSYLSNGAQNGNGANRMYHGQPGSGGVLKSMIGFGTAVSSFIGNGTVTKIEVYLKNTHTYAASGMTAAIGWHSSGVKSSTYAQTWTHASTYGTRTSFNRGQGRWVSMPIGVRNALTGSSPLRGITLDPTTYSSTAYYGHFDGPATRLRITVRK